MASILANVASNAGKQILVPDEYKPVQKRVKIAITFSACRAC